MMKRLLSAAGLSFVVAACAESPAGPETAPVFAAAAANVIQVPGNYATIQEAVDNAAAGNEILVRGAHDAYLIVTTAGIRIRAVAGATLVGSIDVRADNVSIDGFRITTAYASQSIQTGFGGARSGVEIKNNTLVSDGDASDFRGIWLADCRNCSVTNNTVMPHDQDGISVFGDASGTQLKNNRVTGSGIGIYLWPGSSGASVTNNAVAGYAFCGIVNDAGPGAHTFKNNRTDCTLGF